jgi:hypothetical protein
MPYQNLRYPSEYNRFFLKKINAPYRTAEGSWICDDEHPISSIYHLTRKIARVYTGELQKKNYFYHLKLYVILVFLDIWILLYI